MSCGLDVFKQILDSTLAEKKVQRGTKALQSTELRMVFTCLSVQYKTAKDLLAFQ